METGWSVGGHGVFTDMTALGITQEEVKQPEPDIHRPVYLLDDDHVQWHKQDLCRHAVHLVTALLPSEQIDDRFTCTW